MFRQRSDGYWEWCFPSPLLFTPYPYGEGAGLIASPPTSLLDHELLRDTGRSLENWRLTQTSSPSMPMFVSLDSGLVEVIAYSRR